MPTPTNVFESFASYPRIHIDQQTFLGASIRSFSANAGFGDTSSTLNELVVDPDNVRRNWGTDRMFIIMAIKMILLHHLPVVLCSLLWVVGLDQQRLFIDIC